MFNFFDANAGAYAPGLLGQGAPAGAASQNWSGGMPMPWYGQFNWMTGGPWQGGQEQSMEQRINHGGMGMLPQGGAPNPAAKRTYADMAPTGGMDHNGRPLGRVNPQWQQQANLKGWDMHTPSYLMQQTPRLFGR